MREVEHVAEEEYHRRSWTGLLLSLPLLLLATLAASWAGVLPFREPTASDGSYPIKLPLADLPSPLRIASASSVQSLPAAAVGKDGGAASDGQSLRRAVLVERQDTSGFGERAQLAATGSASVESKLEGNSSVPLLRSDFNLAAGSDSPGAIEVRKPVFLNGHAAGTVLIRIGSASQVFVQESEVAELLRGKVSVPDEKDGGFVTLDQIRDRGVHVRYSPEQDALLFTI